MPTPDRLPQPPGPPTLASILADHEREKRRQQRPVTRNIASPSGSGLVGFTGFLTYDGSGTTWTAVSGATTSTNVIAPTRGGWYSCDVTWFMVGRTPHAHVKVSTGGPPYMSGPGGFSHVPTDSSGDGRSSAHWQGLLTGSAGLAVGGDEFFTAYVRGVLVNETS